MCHYKQNSTLYTSLCKFSLSCLNCAVKECQEEKKQGLHLFGGGGGWRRKRRGGGGTLRGRGGWGRGGEKEEKRERWLVLPSHWKIASPIWVGALICWWTSLYATPCIIHRTVGLDEVDVLVTVWTPGGLGARVGLQPVGWGVRKEVDI